MGTDCKYCGAYISGELTQCPACGKRMKMPHAPSRGYTTQDSGSAYAYDSRDYERNDYDTGADFEQTRAEAAAQQRRNASQSSAYGQEKRRENFRNARQSTNSQQYRRESYSANSAENENNRKRSMSFLCYLGILFLLPLISYPNDEFVRFHANQGLVLCIASFIASFLAVFGLEVLYIFILWCIIDGFRNVSRGVMKPLPVIGKIQLLR